MNEGHTTPAGQSVFYDLFPAAQAANLLIRAQLLDELIKVLQSLFSTQADAAAANIVLLCKVFLLDPSGHLTA